MTKTNAKVENNYCDRLTEIVFPPGEDDEDAADNKDDRKTFWRRFKKNQGPNSDLYRPSDKMMDDLALKARKSLGLDENDDGDKEEEPASEAVAMETIDDNVKQRRARAVREAGERRAQKGGRRPTSATIVVKARQKV